MEERRIYPQKTKFENFRVFSLVINECVFIVKMGVFKNDKGLHLYAITG